MAIYICAEKTRKKWLFIIKKEQERKKETKFFWFTHLFPIFLPSHRCIGMHLLLHALQKKRIIFCLRSIFFQQQCHHPSVAKVSWYLLISNCRLSLVYTLFHTFLLYRHFLSRIFVSCNLHEIRCITVKQPKRCKRSHKQPEHHHPCL